MAAYVLVKPDCFTEKEDYHYPEEFGKIFRLMWYQVSA